VAYCNTVLGARTNREGSLSVLAAAIIGKTPNYGLHLEANRVPDLRIYMDAELKDGDIPLIGKRIGAEVANGIPIFTSLGNVPPNQLKALGAAMAATGSVALFHVEGVTPEAHLFTDMNLPQVVIDEDDLERWREEEVKSGEAELIVFGCPHCDADELEEIAGYLEGKKVAEGKRLWVFIPRNILDDPGIQKTLGKITAAGGEVYADTCCVVAPLEDLGLSGIVTDSGKASVYLKNFCKTQPRLMSKSQCIEYAIMDEA
jgi:predicted aconitase